jgi:23S rRNA-intervening sequence protein
MNSFLVSTRLLRSFPLRNATGCRASYDAPPFRWRRTLLKDLPRLKAGEYRHFVNVALSSACETRYLVQLADRLKILPSDHRDLATEYDRVCKGLSRLVASLKDIEAEEKAMR